MAKYSINDSTLTAIADPVRVLLGASGAMTPMQMAENLESATTNVSDQSSLIAQIKTALDGKAVGGGSSTSPQTKTTTPSSNARSISFSGLSKQPSIFVVTPAANITLNSSTRYATSVVYDGGNTAGVYSTTSTATYTTNGFTFTYSNGTLTINTASTSNGGYFRSGVAYKLVYM